MLETENPYTPPSPQETHGPPAIPAANQLEKQPWNGWWTLLWGVVVILVWLTLQSIILLGYYFTSNPSQDPLEMRRQMEALQFDGDLIGTITLITALLVCPLCYVFGRLKPGWGGWEYLGFKKVGFWQIILWLLLTLAMGLSFNFLAPYLGVEETPEFMKRAAESSQFPILLILGVALGAPFIEEFVFRGLLFRGWAKSLGPWLTMALTSLLWTSMHVQYGLIILTWLFLFGIMIGYARHKTGSIWVPIAMHIFNNTLASIEVMHMFGQS